MTAEARLTEEQLAFMQTAVKGEANIKVQVTDAKGIKPLECDMIWAPLPKNEVSLHHLCMALINVCYRF